MKILKDADLYLNFQEWAQKQIGELGYEGAMILSKTIERAMKKGGEDIEIERMKEISVVLLDELNKYRLRFFMAPGIEAVKQVKKFSQVQRQNRAKRKTWHGDTQEKMALRNQTIIDHFRKTTLTPANFAEKYGKKYGLSPRTIRLILSKAVGN